MEFSGNYNDLSSNKGFQFEFSCSRCGKKHRTSFQPSATGILSSVLETASGIFGGAFGTAAELGEKVRSASWGQAHDTAFEGAMKEMAPFFKQCPKCTAWVCVSGCWNAKSGLCKTCAPDLGVEMAAAQAAKAVQEVQEAAMASQEDSKMIKDQNNWKETIAATCPQCGIALEKASKFCPGCGEKLHKDKFCASCGAKVGMDTKFCPECGQKAA